jgi:autotransporter-associated beta strand protein
MNPSRPHVLRRFGCFLISLIMVGVVRGAVDTWNSKSSGAWGTSGNWSAGVPTSASIATFNTTGALKTALTLSASSRADSLVFSAAGGAKAYTFDTAGSANSNNLTLTSGITNSAAATQTFYNTFTLAGNQTWNAGSGALVINGRVNLGSGASSYGLTVNGANAVTLAGVIANGGSPAGSLTYAGTGILTLKGANTYTGATTVNSGTLLLGASNVIADSSALTIASGAKLDLGLGHSDTVGSLSGGGSVDLKNGTLTAGDASSTSFSGVIGDSGNKGSFTKQGAGTLTLSGANTYTGATTINAGTLLLGASNVLSASTDLTIASGATVDLGWGHSATVASLAGGGTLDVKGGPFTVGSASNTVFSGSIIDSGGYGAFVKQGTGTLTLSGNNTFNGVTTINAGVLDLQSNTALGVANSGNTVAGGAALQLQGNITLTEGSFGIAGSGPGSTGAIRNLSGNNTLNSAINLNASSTLGADAGTLTVTGDFNLGSGQTLTTTGAGTITLSGGLNGASGLTQAGTGTLELAGSTANSHTGTTAVNNGTLQLNKTAGTNAIGGGALTIGDGIGAANSATVVLLASNQIADYAGLVTINSDGRLNLNNQSESINTLAGTGSIAFGTTGYLGVGINSGSSTFGGSLTGTGILEKLGSGTLTFNSSFNFGGELRITSGTVVLAGITATVGVLHITGNTILDFGNSSASTLNATTLIIDAGVTLTITNWLNATDYFFAQNFNGALPGTRGTTPVNQITFTGSSNNDTTWQSYDHQITPTPEPSTYGALFIGLSLGLVAWRRHRSHSLAGA